MLLGGVVNDDYVAQTRIKIMDLPVIAVNCCINPFTPGADASPSAAILPPQTTTQMLRVRSAVLSLAQCPVVTKG